MKISLHGISQIMHLQRSMLSFQKSQILLVMLKTKRVQVVSEKNQHRHTGNEMETAPVADLNSTILDAPSPHRSNFLHIMQLSGKYGRIIPFGVVTHFQEILDPPLGTNSEQVEKSNCATLKQKNCKYALVMSKLHSRRKNVKEERTISHHCSLPSSVSCSLFKVCVSE